jgi:hypothetical protein
MGAAGGMIIAELTFSPFKCNYFLNPLKVFGIEE